MKMKSTKVIFSLLCLTSVGAWAMMPEPTAQDLKDIAQIEKEIKTMKSIPLPTEQDFRNLEQVEAFGDKLTPQQRREIKALVEQKIAKLSPQEVKEIKAQLKDLEVRMESAIEKMTPKQVRELKNGIKAAIQAEIDKLTPAQIEVIKKDIQKELNEKLYVPFIKPLLDNAKVKEADRVILMDEFMQTLGNALGAYVDVFEKAAGFPNAVAVKQAEQNFNDNFVKRVTAKLVELRRSKIAPEKRVLLAYEALLSYGKNMKKAIEEALGK